MRYTEYRIHSPAGNLKVGAGATAIWRGTGTQGRM
jgi:hypothetical protein